MKKRQFDWLMLAASFAAAAAAAIGCLFALEECADETISLIIWSGVFFCAPLMAALTAVVIVESIRRREYIIGRKGSRVLSFAVAFVLSLALGCGGQALYMLARTEASEEKVEKGHVDLSILVDTSGSMEGCMDTCINAVSELIDELDARDNAEVISFSDSFKSTELLAMDKDGKNEIKDFVSKINAYGGTEINPPMRRAISDLTGGGSDDARKVIIIITDAEAYPSYKSELIDNGIQCNAIFLSTYDTISIDMFAEYVEDTGGKYVTQKINSSGDVDLEELKGTLTDIYETSTEKNSETFMEPKVLAVGNDGLNLWRIIVRILIFAAYAVLVTWVYYYSVSPGSVISGAAMGAATMGIVTAIGGEIGIDLRTAAAAAVMALLFWSAFTTYQRGGDESFNEVERGDWD